MLDKILPTLEHERKIGAELEDALSFELALFAEARTLLARLFHTVSIEDDQAAGSLHAVACGILAPRVVNDARMMTVAIEHGYLQQALSISAGMSDAAFALGAIAGDETRAQKWLDHADLGRHAFSTQAACNVACEKAPETKPLSIQQKHFYSAYQFLSAPKHAHAQFVQRLGIREASDEFLSISVGPSSDGHSVGIGKIALVLSTQIILLSATAYLSAHKRRGRGLKNELAACTRKALERLQFFRENFGDSKPNPAPRFDANGVRIPD